MVVGPLSTAASVATSPLAAPDSSPSHAVHMSASTRQKVIGTNLN
jgi:hypothetical protein